MKNHRVVWKACAEDMLRIQTLTTAILARLTYFDDASPEDLTKVRKLGAYAVWLKHEYDQLAKELR